MIDENNLDNASSLIKVKNLTKKYGNFAAVDNISFSANKGEIIGFLGLNGAGKSTTMAMLSGCLNPTSGEIEIGGYNIKKNRVDAAKLIGYLPDVPPVYDNMSIVSYLKFVCELKGIIGKNNIKKEVERLVDITHLEEKRNKRISTLSKGYRQRVGMAQALAGSPDVLILDEPTSGLDPAQIVEVRNLFKQIAKEHTIILSTHILSEVESIYDRILIINKGKLVFNERRENVSQNDSLKKYRLIVKCSDSNQIISAIEKSNEEMVVKNLKSTANDIVSFDLEVTGVIESDIYLKISKVLIENNISILQFKSVEKSLESLFLSLVKNEGETIDDEFLKVDKKGVLN